MNDFDFNIDAREYIAELDAAAAAHQAWSRRLLRCAILGAVPDEDVLADDAHRRCRFGQWFERNRDKFDLLDAAAAKRLDDDHRRMHRAAQALFLRAHRGEPGSEGDLDEFERTQAGVIRELARFKTECLTRAGHLVALTGLPLRHGLEEEFKRCRFLAERAGSHLLVVLLDVDHFKRVNDMHGHAVGDLALQHMAAALRATCRAGEPLFRYGGEEFLVLLQAKDSDGVEQAALRLLQALQSAPMRLPDGRTLRRLRASAGAVVASSEMTVAAPLVRADQALYAVEAAGRSTWPLAAKVR